MSYSYLLNIINTFFRLLRWENLVLISCVLVGIYQFGSSSSNSIDDDFGFYMYLCAVNLVMAGGNVINDYYDYQIDLLNKPTQVIVGVFFTRRVTIWIYFTLTGLSFFFVQGSVFLLYAISSIFILWLYSYKLKKLPLIGNFVVALLTFYSINLLSYFIISGYPVIEFAFFAAFVQLLREIVKDLEDVKGDRDGGCKTFPVLFGQQNTKVVIYIISGVFLCTMSYWQWSLQEHILSLYAVYYLLVVFCVKIYRANHKSHFTFLSGLLKMMMVVGLSTVFFL